MQELRSEPLNLKIIIFFSGPVFSVSREMTECVGLELSGAKQDSLLADTVILLFWAGECAARTKLAQAAECFLATLPFSSSRERSFIALKTSFSDRRCRLKEDICSGLVLFAFGLSIKSYGSVCGDIHDRRVNVEYCFCIYFWLGLPRRDKKILIFCTVYILMCSRKCV